MKEFLGRSGGSWRYDPKKVLGKGAFGSVHQGEDAITGAKVAVKVVRKRALGGKKISTRLRDREAEIANKLRDVPTDHVVRIIDVAEVGETLVLVLELAVRSLAEAQKDGLTESEALRALTDIAAGLQELHQAGVIHRDLKPLNVLEVAGVWKLADFGIAHDVDLGTQTATFRGAGTYPYMAPELFKMQSANVMTDLYAFGCVAYELLAGTPPFAGPDPDDYRRQHLTEAPSPLPGSANATMASVVMRLLSKDPAERPQDARAVLERLRKIAIPLSPAQQDIQRLAAQHSQERAATSAARAAAQAQADQEEQRRKQAIADLEEILLDAEALLQVALPGEVQLHVEGPQRWNFGSHDATLLIELWGPLAKSKLEPDDPILLVGYALGSNRRLQDTPPLCNIVAEIDGGRVVWKIYRFRASSLVRTYEYGPRDRSHGMLRRVFDDEVQRSYMRQRPLHVWSLEKQSLTDQAVVSLFRDALALT